MAALARLKVIKAPDPKANAIKIYLDEDAMNEDLVAALRSRGISVRTVLEAGLTETSDERIVRLCAAKTAQDMRNRIEFLTNWR